MEFGLAQYLQLIVWAVFVNNFILAQFLGICPFLGVSKKIESAMGMGLAVVFVMTVSSVVTWLLYRFLLVPLELTYLKTLVFILVIAALVQFVEMVIRKVSPALFQALGIFLPLITTNCAVLGVCLINIGENYSFIKMIVSSFSYALGFGLALVLFSGIREVLALADTPRSFRGTAIALLTAGTLSLSFMGFAGLVK